MTQDSSARQRSESRRRGGIVFDSCSRPARARCTSLARVHAIVRQPCRAPRRPGQARSALKPPPRRCSEVRDSFTASIKHVGSPPAISGRPVFKQMLHTLIVRTLRSTLSHARGARGRRMTTCAPRWMHHLRPVLPGSQQACRASHLHRRPRVHNTDGHNPPTCSRSPPHRNKGHEYVCHGCILLRPDRQRLCDLLRNKFIIVHQAARVTFRNRD